MEVQKLEDSNKTLEERIVDLEGRIQTLERSTNRYGFSRFAVDLLTGFSVVALVIFVVAFIFVLSNRGS
ncbi:hypothetical protein EL26_23790 [Tumebacillus flagellatus]|uniref:Uncharacterized protein n=1 Tax=Tumebacillus flagellatus TaxID=1157490 RepID=A0A074LF79_9BACL|nr:hypothetical protein EL26_23790 [Tumebacillus flagellatus]